MKKVKDEIWILADDRAGNYSQALGLADELGLNQKIVNVRYGAFAMLPNLFLGSSLAGINQETKKVLSGLDYYPKLIIAAGRRTAPISLYLKKMSKNKTKIVQIMNPGISHEKFDFIILPRHDRIKGSYGNVIRSIGALTKVSERAVNYDCEKFKDLFDDKSKLKIALLVGGDSKKTKFSVAKAKSLAIKSSEVAKNMKAELLVLTSRRTSEKNSATIERILKESGCDYRFFDYKKLKKDENPYLAILGFADYFIVSGDSVSMISEVCSTSKPVYIFDEGKISSVKHKKFHKSLLLENYARKLEYGIEKLEKFSVRKLNETKRIAAIIKENLN